MDYPRLRLTSRRLNSGRFQVNFSARILSQEFYGYVLAEPKTPVMEVVRKIGRHVEAMQHSERYFQRNLYSLTHREATSGKILVFRSDKRKAA